MAVAVVGVALLLALDVQRVGASDAVGALQPGDYLLLDRLAGELGRVSPGQVVAVRRRGPAAHEELRAVRGLEGTKVAGRAVERGHVALFGRAGHAPETLPLGDVVAVARLRVRRSGERWAVDLVP